MFNILNIAMSQQIPVSFIFLLIKQPLDHILIWLYQFHAFNYMFHIGWMLQGSWGISLWPEWRVLVLYWIWPSYSFFIRLNFLFCLFCLLLDGQCCDVLLLYISTYSFYSELFICFHSCNWCRILNFVLQSLVERIDTYVWRVSLSICGRVFTYGLTFDSNTDRILIPLTA